MISDFFPSSGFFFFFKKIHFKGFPVFVSLLFIKMWPWGKGMLFEKPESIQIDWNEVYLKKNKDSEDHIPFILILTIIFLVN